MRPTRRIRSFTRQIMADLAAKNKSTEENQNIDKQDVRESDESLKDAVKESPSKSNTDVEFLRNMGVEIHDDDIDHEEQKDNSQINQTPTTQSNVSESTIRINDSVRILPFSSLSGDVLIAASWFSWNEAKETKQGQVGTVVNLDSNGTKDSALIEFEDGLRFLFPLSFIERCTDEQRHSSKLTSSGHGKLE